LPFWLLTLPVIFIVIACISILPDYLPSLQAGMRGSVSNISHPAQKITGEERGTRKRAKTVFFIYSFEQNR
jgi:hypothetical protein